MTTSSTHASRPPEGDATPRPTEHSPLEFPFGCFVADTPSYGGAEAFDWFPNETAVLAHLRGELALFYAEGEDAIALARAIAAATAGCDRLLNLDLDALNLALLGACEVRWVGNLDDLYTGTRPFELEIQQDFRNNIFGDERGFAESELVDFAHHLEHYAQ